jgi:putative transposase
MSNLRRYHKEGNIYFITNVTYGRKPILVDNVDLFWDSVESVKRQANFEFIAYAILPDHFHVLIDPIDFEISKLLQKIKMSFGVRFRTSRNIRSGRVWQNRFWDHIIRNQSDMNRHIDYIHYNPVKHGLAKSPFDWKYSSIHAYKVRGYYSEDWGRENVADVVGQYGE